MVYRIVSGSAQGYPDAGEFIDSLNALELSPIPEARTLFEKASEVWVARAPGRLDVMGGIADYSGSLVLQLPIREATLVALQLSTIREHQENGRMLRIVSFGAEANHRAINFEMPLSALEHNGAPLEYADARRYFHRDRTTHWAAYVAGAFLVLMRERGLKNCPGARILISSKVPEGKGVSSSAAIEVATMQALAAACGLRIAPRDMALLCQKVENSIVGAPCGVMDQMTSAYGEENRLLALLCQPAELQGQIALPDDIAVWGLDSGVRHSVSGADYSSVRIGAFMGYRMIAELDDGNRGYLANITPHEFETKYKVHIPERMSGKEFLNRYGGTTDHATQIDPEKTYAVRIPAAHPVFENDRVARFSRLLSSSAPIAERLPALGQLMFESHSSYSACGLGSEGTDLLVQLVKTCGKPKGIFGAKITGGGSGGTVAVIGMRGAGAAIEEIVQTYMLARGHRPYVFSGSSPGAAAFGTIRLRLANE